MDNRRINMGTTTSVIRALLNDLGGGTFFNQTPEDVYVDCEVNDVKDEEEED